MKKKAVQVEFGHDGFSIPTACIVTEHYTWLYTIAILFESTYAPYFWHWYTWSEWFIFYLWILVRLLCMFSLWELEAPLVYLSIALKLSMHVCWSDTKKYMWRSVKHYFKNPKATIHMIILVLPFCNVLSMHHYIRGPQKHQQAAELISEILLVELEFRRRGGQRNANFCNNKGMEFREFTHSKI